MSRAGRIRTVVVGAGTAGCMVAAGLVRRGDREVVVVEAGAGGPVPEVVRSPDWRVALDAPGRTWALTARHGAHGPVRPYMRGRGLGGSSSVNAMIATVAPAEAYERWVTVHGCAAWGWRDLEPVFAHLDVPSSVAAPNEVGPVARAVLGATAALPGWVVDRALLARRADGTRALSADLVPDATVVGEAEVERLVVDGDRVRGVRFRNGVDLEADEVVLSAGAVHTPTMLIRSGLDRDGVGDHLSDHPSCAISFPSAGRLPPGVLPTTVLATFPGKWQILPIDTEDWSVLSLSLLSTRGRGKVVVDGRGEPVVQLAHLDDPADLAAMIEGVRHVRQLLRHPGVASMADAVSIDENGTPLAALDDPDVLVDWLRAAHGGSYHAAGTCRMGTVVDTTCRVVGVEGLRIVDASVLPELPPTNPQQTVLAVAALAVDRWDVARPR
jgi:5-(hydroxymethyl)furfural/furfural oxidase